MKRLILLSLLASLTTAQADPLVTSWYTGISSKYARIYTSAANRTAGTSASTWTGTQSQATPAYAGVNEVNSSPNYVYIRTSGLAAHVMGPWNNPNLPKNQALVWRFPRNPTVPGSNRVTTALTGMGAIGFLVDGVAAYNTSDGFSYSFANSTDATPNGGIGAGDGIWNRDAFPNEAVSFDLALAHNQPSGEYHYHVNPIATRYLVGDNVTYNSSAKTYAENTSTTNFQHSPIIGWMKDGLPLYGAYGYDGGSTGATGTANISGGAVTSVTINTGGTLYQSVPLVTFTGGGGSGAAGTVVLTSGVVTSITMTAGGTGYTSAPTVKIGGVRRMISGYQLRDGTNNTTNLNTINNAVSTTTGRTSLPAWALTSQNRAQLSTASQYGPAVGASYLLGHFVEDYDYLGDLGFVQGSRTNAGGVFFDLDEYNTRFCVTPEYPSGTWAYFTTIKADGISFYPYSVGRWYRGNPTTGGGNSSAATMNADTPLTNQVLAGANTPIAVSTPNVSSGTVSLTWSAVEGGTYSVDASTNQSTWTSKSTGLSPTVPTAPTVGSITPTGSSSYTTLGASGTEYARVNRTALATYDATGQTASTVAQSTIQAYSAAGIPNTAPTITAIATQSTAQNTVTSAIAFSIGDAETAATSLTLTGSSSNTTLIPNASIVFGGSGANRTATITPATNQTGSATITISVSDGIATTPTTFTLNVTASAPTITSVVNTPASPVSTDSVAVTANVAAPLGRTLSSVQLTYNAGGSATTVFSETMAAAAVAQWTGTNANNPWTIAFGGPPTTPFSQTAVANHTASGQGNQFGMEITASAPNIINSVLTTTNAINATGTSGTVEFYMMTANLSGVMGWDFQTTTDGTTYTTRLSELTGSNHSYQQYTYTLSAGERVSTLKLRFRFVGSGIAATQSKISLDDIKVTTGGAGSPVTVSMFDDGAHGDGTSGDGIFGASIPAQATNTTVSYSVTATDSTTAATTSGSSSYTVGLVTAAAMTVTPATGLTSSGYVGGGISPSSASYTITNSGNASMNWTASKTASWLTLSNSGGTLAAGATATVNATINSGANSLAAGGYNDTIAFTNTTNAAGNTTRAVSLTISTPTAPASPTLAALPTFSQGASKTITWPAIGNATTYTVQISATSDFSTVLTQQTVTSASANFTNLANNTLYYYRVLATNSVGSSSYSNTVSSTQDTGAPSVSISTPSTGTSTAATSIVVSGSASDSLSGVANVTVNGVTVTTSDNFATWTITVPLGFGTNALTAVAYDGAGNTTTTAPVSVTLTTTQTYNPLIVPEVMTGTTFNLNLHQTSKQFLSGAATTTYAYNNMLMWGPTLIMNKGDWVQMNVTNSLADTTTTHWHGFHIPAIMDGGPHQTIPAGTTWSPSFKVDNNAGTYWYHPHLHATVQEQLTKGGGGFIIIRDPIESALTLPRTYGVDDFPLAITSRRFTSNQFVTANSAYGDQVVVNGGLSPQVTLPKQYVRLRILNAETERSYNLGFSDGRTFYQIATDGGLVNAPVALTRLVLAVGERTEILVDLTGATVGATLDLQAFNSGQGNDFPGGEPATTGQFGSLLNNTTFTILHINVGATTSNPVTTRPSSLTTNALWINTDATNTRTVTITGGIPNSATPLFTFDNTSFSPTVFNQTLNLNAIEKWTVTNTSGFSHSFHIHDIQFHLTGRTGGNNAGIKSYEEGWKDVFFIGQNQTVTFVAKFDGFASNTNPFMYHCHFTNHEDEGLMGQFIVQNNAVEDIGIASFTRTGNNSLISLDFKATPGTTYTLQFSTNLSNWTDIGSVTSDGTTANFTETDTSRLGQPKGFYRVSIPTVP